MALYLSLYLILGLFFIAMVDWIAQRHLPEDQQFTNLEKFFVVLLWPLNLVIFLVQLVKTYLDLRNKNK